MAVYLLMCVYGCTIVLKRTQGELGTPPARHTLAPFTDMAVYGYIWLYMAAYGCVQLYVPV